jgi:large subunit ribosomal protein L21
VPKPAKPCKQKKVCGLLAYPKKMRYICSPKSAKFLGTSTQLIYSMYVIVEIAGQQFKAEKGRKLYVHRLQGDVESSISFDKVLLADNDGQVKVGAPVVEGASVKCKILKHLKDDKVLVFKKKRRTGYQKCNGHRQYLTQILVEEIVA